MGAVGSAVTARSAAVRAALGGRARGVLAVLHQGDYGSQAVGGGVVRVER